MICDSHYLKAVSRFLTFSQGCMDELLTYTSIFRTTGKWHFCSYGDTVMQGFVPRLYGVMTSLQITMYHLQAFKKILYCIRQIKLSKMLFQKVYLLKKVDIWYIYSSLTSLWRHRDVIKVFWSVQKVKQQCFYIFVIHL